MLEGDRWCLLVVAGAELVAAGAELVAAGAELVAASARKWPLVQEWYLPLQ